MPRPGSLAMTPRIVNVACPIDDLVADRDAERRQQLGPDEHAVVLAAARASRSGRPAASTLPYSGKPRLHRAQLRHPRDRLRPVRRPHHRRRLDRLGPRRWRRPRRGGGRSSRAPRRSSRGWSRSARRRRSATWPRVPNTPRTLWITERSATIAATPTAMQTKKNSSRRHDARVSRTAIRRTNIMRRRPRSSASVFSTTRPSRRTSRASAIAASSASCVTSTSVVPRPAWIVAQQLHDVPAVGACRDCRSARRPARSADRWRARAPARRAAARRPTAATDSDARGRSARPPRAAARRAAAASATPAISIGTATFS